MTLRERYDKAMSLFANIETEFSKSFWKKIVKQIEKENKRFEQEEHKSRPTQEQMNRPFDI